MKINTRIYILHLNWGRESSSCDITPKAESCVTTEHAAGLAKDKDLTLSQSFKITTLATAVTYVLSLSFSIYVVRTELLAATRVTQSS